MLVLVAHLEHEHIARELLLVLVEELRLKGLQGTRLQDPTEREAVLVLDGEGVQVERRPGLQQRLLLHWGIGI